MWTGFMGLLQIEFKFSLYLEELHAALSLSLSVSSTSRWVGPPVEESVPARADWSQNCHCCCASDHLEHAGKRRREREREGERERERGGGERGGGGEREGGGGGEREGGGREREREREEVRNEVRNEKCEKEWGWKEDVDGGWVRDERWKKKRGKRKSKNQMSSRKEKA